MVAVRGGENVRPSSACAYFVEFGLRKGVDYVQEGVYLLKGVVKTTDNNHHFLMPGLHQGCQIGTFPDQWRIWHL